MLSALDATTGGRDGHSGHAAEGDGRRFGNGRRRRGDGDVCAAESAFPNRKIRSIHDAVAVVVDAVRGRLTAVLPQVGGEVGVVQDQPRLGEGIGQVQGVGDQGGGEAVPVAGIAARQP